VLFSINGVHVTRETSVANNAQTQIEDEDEYELPSAKAERKPRLTQILNRILYRLAGLVLGPIAGSALYLGRRLPP
jgi:hypothetical protein